MFLNLCRSFCGNKSEVEYNNTYIEKVLDTMEQHPNILELKEGNEVFLSHSIKYSARTLQNNSVWKSHW